MKKQASLAGTAKGFQVVRGEFRVRLDLVWPHDDWRGARAEMLRLAASLEERSRSEEWVIQPDQNIGSLGAGRMGSSVAIELMHATAEEADRAEKLLRAVAQERRTK